MHVVQARAHDMIGGGAGYDASYRAGCVERTAILPLTPHGGVRDAGTTYGGAYDLRP